VAGTSWDKLGQMDAAFEEVAPAIRKVAQEEGVKLHEFFRDDPVWRLDFAREAGGEAVVDVAWSEDAPERFTISASWWIDDWETTLRRLHREEIGVFQRSQSPAELEAVLRQALEKVDSWDEAVLDQQSGPYPDWQKYQTREDFQRIRLPRR
jgi:hypothetical protein